MKKPIMNLLAYYRIDNLPAKKFGMILRALKTMPPDKKEYHELASELSEERDTAILACSKEVESRKGGK